MLEQDDTLGGQTHSFSREGSSWDAGLHYLGGFGPDVSDRAMLVWLCESPTERAPMGSVYDTLHIADAESTIPSAWREQRDRSSRPAKTVR